MRSSCSIGPGSLAIARLCCGAPALSKNIITVKIRLTVFHVPGSKIQYFPTFNALKKDTQIKIFEVKPVGNTINEIGMITTGNGSIIGIDDTIAVDVLESEITGSGSGSNIIPRCAGNIRFCLIDAVNHITEIAAQLGSHLGDVPDTRPTGSKDRSISRA